MDCKHEYISLFLFLFFYFCQFELSRPRRRTFKNVYYNFCNYNIFLGCRQNKEPFSVLEYLHAFSFWMLWSQHAKCSLSLPQQNCLTTNRAAATLKKHRFFQIKNKRLLINQIVPGSNEKPALSPVCPYKRTEGGRVRQICLRRIKAHRLHCTFFILIPTWKDIII